MVYFHLLNMFDVWACILCLLVVGRTNHDTNCTFINVIPNVKNRNGPKTRKENTEHMNQSAWRKINCRTAIAETQQGKRASNN